MKRLKMNKDSETFGTIIKGQSFMSLVSQRIRERDGIEKKEEEEITV